jgi:hypothetical protein
MPVDASAPSVPAVLRRLSGRGARVLALGLALGLAGCAAPDFVPAGAQAQDVLARLGPPTGRYPLPGGGERLQYSRLPAGLEVFNLDFDARGVLQSRTQALQTQSLYQVQDGWTAADVRFLLGAPAYVGRVASFDGIVWTYRFREINNPRLFHVHIDPSGVVRRVMFADEIRGFEPALF